MPKSCTVPEATLVWRLTAPIIEQVSKIIKAVLLVLAARIYSIDSFAAHLCTAKGTAHAVMPLRNSQKMKLTRTIR